MVLLFLAFLVGALAYHIRYIQADFTPQDLFSSFDDQEQIIQEFREAFGTTDNVVLMLVRSGTANMSNGRRALRFRIFPEVSGRPVHRAVVEGWLVFSVHLWRTESL